MNSIKTFLGHVPMRIKTVLACLLPAIVSLVFSVVGMIHATKDHAASKGATELLEGIHMANRLLNTFQRERESALLYLSSTGLLGEKEVKAAARDVDDSISELSVFFSSRERLLGGDAQDGHMGVLSRTFQEIGLLRDSLFKLEVAPSEIYRAYSIAAEQTISLAIYPFKMSPDIETRQAVDAVASMFFAREAAGHEAAILTKAFSADLFQPGMYRLLNLHQDIEASMVREYRLAAPEAFQSILDASSYNSVEKKLTHFRNLAHSNAETGHFGVDPLEWTDLMEKKNAVYDDLIESLLMEIQDMVQSHAAAAKTRIFTQIVVTGFVMLVILGGIYVLRTLIVGIEESTRMAKRIRNGEFSGSIVVSTQDEIGELMNAMDSMSDQIKAKDNSLSDIISKMDSLLETVAQSVANANENSSQLEASSQELTRGATVAASTLVQVQSSMNGFDTLISQTSENAKEAEILSVSARNAAEQGNDQMKKMIQAMESINGSSNEISKVIKVIDDIAFQTNLLALNAAVEAARAGQHGKGFAVVADEVRNLASRSAEAAKTTAELVEASGERVKHGIEIADQTALSLEEIVCLIKKSSDYVSEIASDTQDQADTVKEVSHGLGHIGNVIQQNSQGAGKMSVCVQELCQQANNLKHILDNYQGGGWKGVLTTTNSKLKTFPFPQAVPGPTQSQPIDNGDGLDAFVSSTNPPPPSPTAEGPGETLWANAGQDELQGSSMGNVEDMWGRHDVDDEPQIRLDDDEFGRY